MVGATDGHRNQYCPLEATVWASSSATHSPTPVAAWILLRVAPGFQKLRRRTRIHEQQRDIDMIGQDELLKLTGLSQRAALRRHLKKAGIPFKELNGRILTTEEAITASLVGRAKKKTQPNFAALDD